MVAHVAADHPDVRRLQRELSALKSDLGDPGEGDLSEQRRKVESELAMMNDRYGEPHSDVQRLRRSLAALEAADVRFAVPKAPAER